MKILITGATGYVGSQVVAQLLTHGHTLLALTRPGGTAPPNTTARYAELTDTQALSRAVDGVDAVGYFAASNEPAFAAVSEAAVHHLIDCLRPGQRFAMHSGSMVFGDTGNGAAVDAPHWNPPPPLQSRAAFEAAILALARPDAPTRSIVYGALVHGGGRGAMIPAAIIQAARASGRLTLPPVPDVQWSTVHVTDWAELIVHTLVGSDSAGGVWLAAGPQLALAELIAEAAQLTGAPVPEVGSFEALESAYGFFGPAFMLNQRFDARRAMQAFGWKATRNDWAASLRELL
jgi:nucleoside-diphosphate-sugar epimerase